MVFIAQANLIFAFLNPLLQLIDTKRRSFSNFAFYNLLISILFLSFFYITDCFQVINVAQNSSLHQPIIYKISALWGNHEGSMLLFCLFLSFWQFLSLRIKSNLNPQKISFVIAAINSCFLFFILFFGNPFFLSPIENLTGLGLNPILQDSFLTIHPPILYLGYTSTILSFTYAIIALHERKIDQNLWEKLKIFNMFSWVLMLIGITLGSWWAYKELGWGGVWFWDPVENISLLPFLCSTALVHTLKTVRGNPKFQKINLFLSALNFCLCAHGFFLTRSGILQSIHTFAIDKSHALVLFALTSAIILSSLSYFFCQQKHFSASKNRLNYSGKFIYLEFILSITILIIIYFSIIYPIFFRFWHGREVLVSEQFFNQNLFILLLCTIFLMSILDFRKKKFFSYKILAALLINLLISWIFRIPITKISILAQIILFLSSVLCWISIIDLFCYFFYKRKRNLNMLIAHLGFGVLFIGLIVSNCLEKIYQIDLCSGQEEMNLRLVGFIKEKKENHLSITAQLMLEDRQIFYPQIKFFPINNSQVAEPYIKKKIFYDLHVVMTDFFKQNDSAKFTIEFKPLINLVWLGVILMIMGSLNFFKKGFIKKIK